MICEVCSDKIEPGEATVMHDGKPVHEACYLIKDDVTPGHVPPPAVDQPDELELAFRRGDEIATVRKSLREAGLACSRGSGEIERLIMEKAALVAERDAALRRCKDLETMARQRAANPPEGAEVYAQ